ncbi:MAG: hypothetical protein NT069_21515 [Planctomycetota bacterium]|nr:hypothetical protein [Planctomycetota bacterium]
MPAIERNRNAGAIRRLNDIQAFVVADLDLFSVDRNGCRDSQLYPGKAPRAG